MKKKLQNWHSRLNNSKYVFPFIFFAGFFILTSVGVFIFEQGRNSHFTNVIDGFWWMIITFSTTGYGDKVPITFGGRMLAVLSIFIGIVAMSYLSGTLASVFVEKNTRARRGLMDFPRLKDHFIICGWKEHMNEILLDILTVSGDITSDKLVIVSNISSEKIEELKEHPQLKGLRFVRGDYFSEATLTRANVQKAQKVLILADSFESHAASEVDSKTVMTVLTIKAMSRDIYTCAELLDRKYHPYLKQAACDEVLFSRDFGRRMLATASVTNGMSHIVYELLAPDTSSSKLYTTDIPNQFFNKTFQELKSHMEKDSHKIVLGILENTGSPHAMKLEALRDAQKTSDVSRLVNNLQDVKGLEVNKPVLLPSAEYVIPRHCRAIVLERVAK